MLTYTLIVGVLKYFLFLGFCLLWFLSFGAFVLWCFCPMVLLSISAFLCPPTWSHDENVDCQHLHHVITWTEMGLYKLIVLVLKYFLFWGFVSFDFSPLGLLSYGAFVHFAFSLSAHVIAWRECWLSTPVSCDHMNRNVTVHLDCWSIKIFPLLGLLSTLIFILWGFCPMVLLSISAFLCPHTWSHDENVDCPHLHHVITWTEMGLYKLIVRVLKYFLFLGFCPLWFLSFGAFVLWCFCSFRLFSVRIRDHMTRMLIVHTCIMWSHEQKWDCTNWLLEY